MNITSKKESSKEISPKPLQTESFLLPTATKIFMLPFKTMDSTQQDKVMQSLD